MGRQQNPLYKALMKPDEDWRTQPDIAERRKIQNRLAQRAYRRNMKHRTRDLEALRQRLSELERLNPQACDGEPTHRDPDGVDDDQSEGQLENDASLHSSIFRSSFGFVEPDARSSSSSSSSSAKCAGSKTSRARHSSGRAQPMSRRSSVQPAGAPASSHTFALQSRTQLHESMTYANQAASPTMHASPPLTELNQPPQRLRSRLDEVRRPSMLDGAWTQQQSSPSLLAGSPSSPPQGSSRQPSLQRSVHSPYLAAPPCNRDARTVPIPTVTDRSPFVALRDDAFSTPQATLNRWSRCLPDMPHVGPPAIIQMEQAAANADPGHQSVATAPESTPPLATAEMYNFVMAERTSMSSPAPPVFAPTASRHPATSSWPSPPPAPSDDSPCIGEHAEQLHQAWHAVVNKFSPAHSLRSSVPSPSCFTSAGQSLLHLAAAQGNTDILELLLSQAGLDVDARDAAGFTPLRRAVTSGQKEVVRTLLEFGADVSA